MSHRKHVLLADARRSTTFFDRGEMNRLLSLYSRQVANGRWRDYAIDCRPGAAEFAIFRHSFESPVYRIVKIAGTSERPACYEFVSGARRLRRADTLDAVLPSFDTDLKIVV
jgi:hypothetical protein